VVPFVSSARSRRQDVNSWVTVSNRGYLRAMKMSTKFRHLPTRFSAGSYILNSGLSKMSADHEKAKHLHAAASGAYPMFEDVDPGTFTKALGAAEVTLGAALLTPLVPSRLAGLGLATFAGGLLGLYMKTPGMRQQGSIRPTDDGLALAKDVWLLGMAMTLVMDRGGSRRKS
jgi:hypothetical protein